MNIGAGPGLGFALGWGTSEAFVIAGAVGISSSAIATKLLIELRRVLNAREDELLAVLMVGLVVVVAGLSAEVGVSDAIGALISTSCTHLDRIRIIETDVDVCQQCVEDDATWVQLRMCLVCGEVGCCSDSAGNHAGKHFDDTGHPLIRSLEHGDGWQYCYVDQNLVREPAGSADRG